MEKEEFLFVSEKCHLKPKVIEDAGKQYFQCLYSGLRIEKAYLIEKKYGSFYDPIIASTYLKYLEMNGLIDSNLLQDLLKIIAKECMQTTSKSIDQLMLSKNPQNCQIEGTLEYLIFNAHKAVSMDEFNFEPLLIKAKNFKKSKKRTTSTKKRTLEQQQDKKIYCYRFDNSNNKMNGITEINHNDYMILDFIEDCPINKISVNYVHGGFQIFLSSVGVGSIDQINPQVNNLLHGTDQEVYGKTVFLLTTKPLFPDGQTKQNKKKKV